MNKLGLCDIETTSYYKNFFTKENIQAESCTGEVISTYSYFDPSPLIPIALFVMAIACFILAACLVVDLIRYR